MQILFVKNLPTNQTKFDLKKTLMTSAEQFGKVEEVAIVINKQIKLPTAFITFKEIKEENKQVIVDQMNQLVIDDKKIVVNWKQTQQERKNLVQNKTQNGNLHLKNLIKSVTEKSLYSIFEQFGPLLNVSIKYNEKYSSNQAWVQFTNKSDSDKALSTASQEIKDLFIGTEIDMGYHKARLTQYEREQKDNNMMRNMQRMMEQGMQNNRGNMFKQMMQMQMPMMNNKVTGPPQMMNMNQNMMGIQQMMGMQQMLQQNQQQMQMNMQSQMMAKQQPQGEFNSVAGIRAYIERFKGLDKSIKQSHLQSIVTPLINDQMDMLKKQKVSKMLVDFEVFDLDEILDMIDNKEELQARVEEAYELIMEGQE